MFQWGKLETPWFRLNGHRQATRNIPVVLTKSPIAAVSQHISGRKELN